MKNWTEAHIRQLKDEGRIVDYKIIGCKETVPEPKRSKYGNKKTAVNGIEFDSAKEANYYKILLLRRKAGEIGLIELQKEYELNPGGTYSYKYLADFQYIDSLTGQTIVVDVKGYRTKEYKKKKRLMKKVYGIIVMEV